MSHFDWHSVVARATLLLISLVCVNSCRSRLGNDASDAASNSSGATSRDDDGVQSFGPGPQWLRLGGPQGIKSLTAPWRARDFADWQTLKAAKQALLVAHAGALPEGIEWFDNESHGFAGLPYVLLVSLPYVAPDIFGQPEDQFARFGFLADDVGPLPRGLGWKTVQICKPGTKQKPFSAECESGGAIGAINKVTLTCSACHSSEIKVDGKKIPLRGATNILFDVKAWRHAFEELSDRFLAEFPDLLDDRLVTAKTLTAAHERISRGLASAKAAELYRKPPRRADLPVPTVTPQAELALYEKTLAAPFPEAQGAKVSFATLVFRETLRGIAARRGVLSLLKQKAYAGANKPKFDFGYPGSTEAAGEALVTVSLLFGGEHGRADPQLVAQSISDAAAPVDFMNVYNQGHRPDSNWDNVIDAPTARTQTAQLATTGSPEQLDLQLTSVVTNVLTGLPPPPWPFAIDNSKARAGRYVFDIHCVTCHHPSNAKRYGIIGTDMNRFRQFNPFTWEATRKALRATCPSGSTIDETYGEGSNRPCQFDDSRILRNTTQGLSADEQGYAATALHGLWTSSPYFHNGSVLTLAEVLAPSKRRATYVRGTAEYDTVRVGLRDARLAGVERRMARASAPKFSPEELTRRMTYDTSLSGLSRLGHDRDVVIDGRSRRLNFDDEFEGDGETLRPRPGTDAEALLEYLKTL